MRTFLIAVLLNLSLAGGVSAARPYVLVLGVGQDAGVPQMGCETLFCRRAWGDAKLRQTVSSIAVVDPDSKGRWIFDATPDLPAQFESLKAATRDRSSRIDGIFLTHAHVGHYTGLIYLGRESMNTSGIPVFVMPRMKQMLEQNAPWSQLVSLGNVNLKLLADRSPVRLNDRLTVEPFVVPHREEFSETVGFRIRSGAMTIVFIPDIDKWERWSTPLRELVRASDILLLDGTFYADGEIARPMSEVPHPFVAETMELLRSMPLTERRKVHFIHFNHSNPLVQGNRVKIREVRSRGFQIAFAGQKLYL
jgi:pyrroloquinoline quinone biosynthesis protein B